MSAELEPRTVLDLGIPGVRAESMGLAFSGEVSFEEWQAVALFLGLARDWTAWAIGDLLNYAEGHFPDRLEQAAEVLKRSPYTLLEYMRVSRRYPLERRRGALSWTIHELLAARDDAEQERWLDRCQAENINVPELRGLLREGAMSAWAPIEEVRRRAAELEAVEGAARLLLAALAPADDLYYLVPRGAAERLREALGARGAA